MQDTGYIHMINDPTKDPGTEFRVLDLTVDGGGLVEATHLYAHAVNVTIDAGGLVSANEQGYSLSHGPTIWTNGSFNLGFHGIINPGLCKISILLFHKILFKFSVCALIAWC